MQIVDFIRAHKALTVATVFVGSILFVFLLLFFFHSTSPSQKNEPAVLLKPESKIKQYAAPFEEQEVGKAPKGDLTKITGFKEKKQLSPTQIQYIFTSPYISRDNVIIVENGIIIYKQLVLLITSSENPPLMTDYEKQYGQPEKIYKGSKTYGDLIETHLYASKGFALIVNPYNDSVFEIQTFTPMTIDSYIATWGLDITQYKPRTPDNKEANISPQAFSITNTTLTGELIGITQPVEINFSHELNVEKIDISIKPDTPTFFDISKTFLTISVKPQNTWLYNQTYTITVTTKTLDKDNTPLDKNYTFTFKTQAHIPD